MWYNIKRRNRIDHELFFLSVSYQTLYPSVSNTATYRMAFVDQHLRLPYVHISTKHWAAFRSRYPRLFFSFFFFSFFFRSQQVGLQGTPHVLLDPNTLSTDGTSALTGVDFAKDGKKLAYGISKNGSDW